MTKSLVDIAKEYSRAWAEHDPDAIAVMHTDDSVFHLHRGNRTSSRSRTDRGATRSHTRLAFRAKTDSFW